MNTTIPERATQLRTLLKGSGELELSLVDVPVPKPGPAEVLIRVEAAPINPSDLGLLFSAADMSTLRQAGTGERPVVTANVPQGILKALAARIDQSLSAGNEGAGVVVAADSSPEAQAMLGKTVAASAGAMYSQYRSVHVSQCMVLPDGTKPAEGASCFINPLTALGMVETMRREGHKALVHTAAASNLGQMLNRVCLADGIGLVNVVRSEAQQKLLRDQGAQHVCNSTAPGFKQDLEAAIAATGATLCFDAVGGGPLAGQVLASMEAVFARQNKGYQFYGSTTFKQVYIYGGLDPSPTTLKRNYGVAWSLGSWLLPVFVQKVGPEVTRRLQARVVAELTTTFASHYTKEISLAGALRADEIAVYARRVTGEKYLVNPQKT